MLYAPTPTSSWSALRGVEKAPVTRNVWPVRGAVLGFNVFEKSVSIFWKRT